MSSHSALRTQDSAFSTVSRLTALWALSESGLGGMMHALKIPFTGFFLGGFAIVIITLIAYFSENKWRSILQATLLVVLVKAAASPHSPPMAYIAVSFQGLAGALLFSMVPFYRPAAVLFGMMALFESAVQKFLVMTLIFGKSLWEALDLFFQGIAKDLSVSPGFSFSFWLIAIYTGVYTLWGMLLGWWASGLYIRLHEKKEEVISGFYRIKAGQPPAVKTRKKGSAKKLAGAFLILLFIISIFVLQGNINKALYAILRTVAAILLLYYFIGPLTRWAIKKWTDKRRHETGLATLMDTLPELRGYVSPAMQLARQQNKGLFMYKNFVENLIILSLFKKQGNF